MPHLASAGIFKIQFDRVVNVSTVPQRSPFRYPGGKTWLVPLIRKWLYSLPDKPKKFIEPFAGGGAVGLTVAFEALAEKVVLVELDPHVASVWETILKDGKRLAERIKNFEFSQDSVASVLESRPKSKLELAFQTILRNRVQHGGILAPGASLMKHGENGRGLSSRWYPETLYRRILGIHSISDRIEFHKSDGLAFLKKNASKRGYAFFVDPPYTVTGRRLYAYSRLDHATLFQTVANTKCRFLMTYDKSAEIQSLAEVYGLAYQEVLMQGRLNQKKLELVITRDLAWTKLAPADALPFP